MEVTKDDLAYILEQHKLWIRGRMTNVIEGKRADLSSADLRRANLSGADLSSADLSRADLSRANLSDADLSDADLSRANLSDADLRRANLSDAYLRSADLRSADLRDADLRRANLSDADLSRANLSDADLRRANLSGANLSGADLSGARYSLEVLSIIQVGPIGSRNDYTKYDYKKDEVICGCFKGTLDEFAQRVSEKYYDPDNEHGKNYVKAIALFASFKVPAEIAK